MKRSEMINMLVEIYESIPKGASSYHIIDVILYTAERRGMLPPMISLYGYGKKVVPKSLAFKLFEECRNDYVIKWEDEEESLFNGA